MSDVTRLTDRAFEAVEPSWAAQALSELISARSDNPGAFEAEAASVFARQCREAGLATEVIPIHDDRPNVVARLSDGRPGPVILLNSHLDTVPAGEGWTIDPWQGDIREGRVWGLGSTDAKGQLIAMLAAVIAIKRAGLPIAGEILVTAVMDEEVASEGARRLAPSIHADYAIVGEPTLLEVGVAHRGSVRPRFSILGRAAHSSVPHLGKNAIFQALKLLEKLERYCAEVGSVNHPLIGPACASVTSIVGGHNPSTIPDRCDILLDRRMVPGEDPVRVLEQIRGLIEEVSQQNPDFDASIVELLPTTGPPSEISPDAPLVKLALEGLEQATGISRKPQGVTFGCDMTHFRAAKIDTIVMGPGDIGRAHKPDEFIEIEELIGGSKAYAALLVRLFHQT